MYKAFTVWGFEYCTECNEVALDLKKQGKVEHKDLQELKENPPKITDGDCIELDVLAELSMQNNTAPVVSMGDKVLTFGELGLARRGEL